MSHVDFKKCQCCLSVSLISPHAPAHFNVVLSILRVERHEDKRDATICKTICKTDEMSLTANLGMLWLAFTSRIVEAAKQYGRFLGDDSPSKI